MRASVFLIAVAGLSIIGCGPASNPNDRPIITNFADYEQTLQKAEGLSLQHLKDLDAGQPLTDPDKRDLQEAALLFDSLADYQPTNIAPFTGAGKIYQALGNDDAAIKRFREGLSTVPPKPITAVLDTAIETHYLLSVSLFNKHQYKESLDEVNRAIQMFPTSPIYYAQRAAIFIQLGNNKGAYSDLSAALQIDGENVKARRLMKLLLMSATDDMRASAEKKLNAKDFKGVIVDATKGLDVAPDYPVLLNLRAAAYLALGQRDKARADVEHVLRVAPDNPDALNLKKALG